jgi:hypothetical protein
MVISPTLDFSRAISSSVAGAAGEILRDALDRRRGEAAVRDALEGAAWVALAGLARRAWAHGGTSIRGYEKRGARASWLIMLGLGFISPISEDACAPTLASRRFSIGLSVAKMRKGCPPWRGGQCQPSRSAKSTRPSLPV